MRLLRHGRRALTAATMLLCLLGVGACGTQTVGSSAATRAVPTAPPSATTTPKPTPVVETRQVQFPNAAGAMLVGTLYGRGQTAVVFANQTDSTQDNWEALAQTFAVQGYMALTFEYEGKNGSGGVRGASEYDQDVVSAAAFMKEQGAHRVALVGASIGGLAVSVAAGEMQPEPEALVVISAPSLWPMMANTDDYLRLLSMPKLYIDTEQDDEVQDVHYMYDHAPQPKQLQIYPGAYHGVGIFNSPNGDDFSRRIVTFVQINVPA